jgi:hypothetical protein
MGVWIWGHHRSEECWAGETPGAVLTVLKGTAMMIMRATMTTVLLMVMGTTDGPLCIVSAHHVQTSKPPQVQHSIT